MAKGIKDYGMSKLADYHTENHGEPRFAVVPDVLASNKPDGDQPRKVTSPGPVAAGNRPDGGAPKPPRRRAF
jgi:hypothetical protein